MKESIVLWYMAGKLRTANNRGLAMLRPRMLAIAIAHLIPYSSAIVAEILPRELRISEILQLQCENKKSGPGSSSSVSERA